MSAMSETEPDLPPWSPARRIAFRFAFSYLVLYNFPSPLGFIPGTDGLTAWYYPPWNALVLWVGTHLFHLSPSLFGNPEGGERPGFVRMLCVVVLAAAATLVWTLVDRRRRDYRRLHHGLRIYARYLLGCTLLVYGFSKVFPTQFRFPYAGKLQVPYGEMSPMGLLWTFMGYSAAYTIFTGAAEAVAGFLLFFRRTTTLGALLAAAVMTHVVVLNFSYDVPVKVLASNLLLIALFLLAPDLGRLADLLVLNRPTAPANAPRRRFDRAWPRAVRLGLKALVVGYAVLSIGKERFDIWKRFHDMRSRRPSARSELFFVDEVVRNGRLVTSVEDGESRWSWFNFHPDKPSSIVLGERALTADYDAARRTLTVFTEDRKTRLGLLACTRPGPRHLVLMGKLGNDAVAIRLYRLDPAQLLVTRGFHWINEVPLNR
jgi:uncharacterized membrane protein YphA (DoxX/SURF4 family)